MCGNGLIATMAGGSQKKSTAYIVGRSVTLHEAFLTTVGILNPTIGNPESLKIQTFWDRMHVTSFLVFHTKVAVNNEHILIEHE